MRWLAFFQLLWSSSYARQCLPDAVREDERLNITVEGVSMPVGLAVGNWESAYLVADMFQILTQEVLGYHAQQGISSGGSTTMALQLAGCDGVVERPEECPWPSRFHVALELWPNRWFSEGMQNMLANLAARAPRSVGEIGYLGYDGLFVLGKARKRCLEATGLHLSYYGNYNSSWFDPAAHASTLADVDLGKLKRCDESVWAEYSLSGGQYLNATGDADGEHNGQPQLKCYQDKWWLAPACRSNPNRCIAVVTGGNGWGLNYIAQQAYFHNMPLALATAASYNDYLVLNKDQGSALYWWLPDPSFALDDPAAVEFPPENPSEYRQGIYRTMAARSKLLTAVAAGLEDAADRVYGLADHLRLSDSNVADMMRFVAAGGSTWESACEWLKANPTFWAEWVPDKTVCAQGKGMVDLQGQFVFLREEAVDCGICPQGRASKKMDVSRACSLCPEGHFQSTFGTTECQACEAGTVSSTQGASQCEQCGLGKYVSQPGRSTCELCGGGEETWTTSQEIEGEVLQILGATSESSCTCKDGSFLWQGRCESCSEGSECRGNEIQLLPGYFSSSESPGSVYHCKEGFCPGGSPGTCAAGRDARSLACSQCIKGHRPAGDGECERCASRDYVVLAFTIISIIAGVAFLHVALMRETVANQTGALVVVSSSLTQLVTVLQMLAVIGRFNIDWREPLRSILVLLEIISFDPDMLSIGCLGNMAPVSLFSLQVLLIPLLTFIAFLVHLGYLLLSRSKTFEAKHLLRTIGTMFLIFFIMLFSLLMSPFQCSWHPNGLSTLNDYGAVYCNGQDEHLQMFFIGGFACLMPLAFTALCTWIVIWEIPRRLARSDARFLDSCSFLVKRFRPGAEISSVLFLMRNASLVLTVVVYSTSGQLMLFSLILYLNLFLVAYFKPWRFLVCNLLEGALLCGMLVILDIGGITVKESNTTMSSMVLGLFLGLMGLAIFGAIGFGVGKHFQQKYRKQFRFFLCHQKVAAGCMARLLKMELETRLPGTKTFIDCDDLNDLTRLFSYVAQDTETFLIMGSPAILTRKWCVGEMVTGRRHGVKTLLLAWPEYVPPDEHFIANYANVVPDIRELAKYGISLTDVEETFRCLDEKCKGLVYSM